MFTPGDLCIIIKSYCGDEGRIVIFNSYLDGPYWDANTIIWNGELWTECNCLISPVDGILHSVDGLGHIGSHKQRPFRSAHIRKLPEVSEEVERELEVME